MKLFDKLKRVKKPNAPWLKFYTKEERENKVPRKTMYEMLSESFEKYPKHIALNYYGTKISYKQLDININKVVRGLEQLGVRKGDVVSILMPNTPEALYMFYACSKIGAVAEMIHPLSSSEEIKNYLNNTNSAILLMLDTCYDRVNEIIDDTNVYKVIVASVRESMPVKMKLGYDITKGILVKKPARDDGNYISWRIFLMKGGITREKEYSHDYKENSVILHSGGSTGTPKSIMLNDYAFNAQAMQARMLLQDVNVGDKVLAILPIFHGFGLGVCINCSLCKGATVVLVPQFDAKKFDKLINKHKPVFITGVPTLFEALIKCEDADLSSVKYVISGGDNMSLTLVRQVNDYLKSHGSVAQVSQGYGMTEALSAVSCSTRPESNKEGSIGIPLPGLYVKIVTPGTQEEVPLFSDGEICISGDTVMMGYKGNEKETNEALQVHKDGRVWLHSGDMGYMDKDGVIFYRQRIKRMLISSGFNIYPSQIEQVLLDHEAVDKCCVIGVPHPYKVQVAKAFIVLKEGYSDGILTKNSLKEHCKKYLAKYSLPYEYEFRTELPKTPVGKIDFKKLQEEENAKRSKKKK